MRKFYFAQPFLASCGENKCPTKNSKSFDIDRIGSLNQSEDYDYNQESSTHSQDSTEHNNGYVSGAIDLDRALAEYYKSLVR